MEQRTGSVFLVLVIVAAAWLSAGTAAVAAEAGKPVEFNRDILPILSDNCFACHGPDANKRKGDVRLDTKEGLFGEDEYGPIVAPGKAEQSELYAQVITKDDSLVMPPKDSNRALTPAQVDLIKRWIDEGATYSQHWAYVTPRRPSVPEVKDQSWSRNPIDYFILARLETEGLRPSPEADRATLLRRLSFDLTGLPPTPAQIKTFLADNSPQAYEKQVDRLLASPHYGEHMARMWLDLARYADSNGIGGEFFDDSLRTMWPWRDWVIKAYNNNMPYDQFTTRQLAGDLLPGATLQDRIATGFNRHSPSGPFESGDRFPVLGEERANMVADRVITSSTTWLGLTIGCARCHDHKYDPIKQKDFYRLAAYFNNVPEFTSGDRSGNTEPVVAYPSRRQQQQMEAVRSQIRKTLAKLPEKELVTQENQWRTTASASIPTSPKDGLLAYYQLDDNLADSSGNGRDAQLRHDQVAYLDGAVGKGAIFNGAAQVDFGNFAVIDRSTAFALSFWMHPKRPAKDNVLQQHDASPNWAGFEIALDDPYENVQKHERTLRLVVRLASRWPDDAIEIKTKDHPLVSRYLYFKGLGAVGQHLVVSYDGSGRAGGLKLYVDGKLVATEITKDHLTGPARTAASLSVGDHSLGQTYEGMIDDLRVYGRELSPADIDNLHTDAPALALVNWLRNEPVTEIPLLRENPPPETFPDSQPSPDAITAILKQRQQRRLAEYFLARAASSDVTRAYSALQVLRARQAELEQTIPTTMVMAEIEHPMETFVLGRGQYNDKREQVSAGVPAFLLELPPDAPANRLGLARWLVDPKNPLTARVEVNRYWQNFFGNGIVKTAEDFGSQGERPTHPELLDWLATEFVRTGWDIKALQRLIVLSATYRQSSKATPELEEADPQNRLLARGPRVRLTAEEIRDGALAASGLLSEKIGGPSVYPYQPGVPWSEDLSDGPVYTQSAGPDLYRRSLYSVVRRSISAPSFVAFDAPTREVCLGQRNLTNTPLQALVLLNDPTYVEAGRVLAERAILETGQDPGKRLDFLFSRSMGRKPEPVERDVLLQRLQQMLTHYRQEPEAARQLLKVGATRADPKINPAELAAWTTVSRVVLNLDETITKQ